MYVLFLCKEVQSTWFVSPVSGRLMSAHHDSFKQWLVDCFRLHDDEFMKHIFSILWSVWLKEINGLSERDNLTNPVIQTKSIDLDFFLVWIHCSYPKVWTPP